MKMIFNKAAQYLEKHINQWLSAESPAPAIVMNHFESVERDLQVADVILVEGRSRVSQVIKFITQSQWSHAALYVGSLSTTKNSRLREYIKKYSSYEEDEPLVIEALLGQGMILTPLSQYSKDNIRVCRAQGLTHDDAMKVIRYSLSLLGTDYDVRQLLDLARFLFPYAIVPRKWRSSLFYHNAGAPTKTVCSTAIARAFMTVDFPILPFVKKNSAGQVRLIKKNPKLFTPRDFDYSPYFQILKHPYVEFPSRRFDFLNQRGVYHDLPWEKGQWWSNNMEGVTVAEDPSQEEAA